VCGDLHLENFGAYRDDKGDLLFDINVFDESLVAPCVLDPVRCVTSILIAAELWELSPLHANRIVLAYLDEYRSAVKTPVETRLIDLAASRLARGPIWEILGKTAAASQGELLDDQTEWLKNGPALDSVLAAASRYVERTRLAFKQFRAERRVPDAKPSR
jgi:uncharacterized protein (DUF2252 family)